MSMHIEDHPSVEGVVRLSHDSSFPAPHVAIVGATHGNETCGLEAIRRVRKLAADHQLRLQKGTVWLIHGNPEATKVGLRQTQDGEDLNRLFNYTFEHMLRPFRWSYEHHRAIALRPILEQMDAMLDLHSTTIDTEPFAISPTSLPSSFDLGQKLGLPYLTYGWDGPGLLSDRVLLAPLAQRECPGLAVECGRHDDPNAVTIAVSCIRNFLRALDVIERAPETSEVKVLKVVAALKKPSAEFCFDKPLRGLDPLVAGTCIGRDPVIDLRMSLDAVALMPNDGVEVGQDMLYIARPDEVGESPAS